MDRKKIRPSDYSTVRGVSNLYNFPISTENYKVAEDGDFLLTEQGENIEYNG